MLAQPSHRSEYFCRMLRRATIVLGYSSLVWLSSITPSVGGDVDNYGNSSAATMVREVLAEYGQRVYDDEQLAQQGPTIVQWIWDFDPPSPIVVGTLLLFFSLLVGMALQALILPFDDPKREDYSRGIRWMAYMALFIPAAVFRVHIHEPILAWLLISTVVTLIWLVIFFGAGYAYSTIKRMFGKPTPETLAFYETALCELENGQLAKGLWAQCLAKSKGNESVAKANYLKARSADLAKLSKSQTRGAGSGPVEPTPD